MLELFILTTKQHIPICFVVRVRVYFWGVTQKRPISIFEKKQYVTFEL